MLQPTTKEVEFMQGCPIAGRGNDKELDDSLNPRIETLRTGGVANGSSELKIAEDKGAIPKLWCTMAPRGDGLHMQACQRGGGVNVAGACG